MSDLITRFEEDLQLAGYAKRSRQSYTASVHRLQRFLQKPLDSITEEDLRQYWLTCKSGQSHVIGLDTVIEMCNDTLVNHIPRRICCGRERMHLDHESFFHVARSTDSVKNAS